MKNFSFSRFVSKVLNDNLKGKNYHLVQLIVQWHVLLKQAAKGVEHTECACSLPYKLWCPKKGYGILYIDVWRRSLMEMQTFSPLFLQASRLYFGYEAIQSVKLRWVSAPVLASPPLVSWRERSGFPSLCLEEFQKIFAVLPKKS